MALLTVEIRKCSSFWKDDSKKKADTSPDSESSIWSTSESRVAVTNLWRYPGISDQWPSDQQSTGKWESTAAWPTGDSFQFGCSQRIARPASQPELPASRPPAAGLLSSRCNSDSGGPGGRHGPAVSGVIGASTVTSMALALACSSGAAISGWAGQLSGRTEAQAPGPKFVVVPVHLNFGAPRHGRTDCDGPTVPEVRALAA
jgi:hypothetical protein